MKNNPSYLTKIQADWDITNLLHLQLLLRYAYTDVKEVTRPDKNPVFSTPNRSFLAGMIRFGAVDYYLERGCAMGLLNGITPVWRDLKEPDANDEAKGATPRGQGVRALELLGKHTSLISHHLQVPEDPPRGSKLRDDMRVRNEQNPLLPAFADNQTPVIAPIHLTLVHGNKSAEFAFLRVYDNFQHANNFLPVGENIMQITPLSTAGTGGAEEIAEAEIKLKKHLKEFRQQQQGEM